MRRLVRAVAEDKDGTVLASAMLPYGNTDAGGWVVSSSIGRASALSCGLTRPEAIALLVMRRGVSRIRLFYRRGEA